MSVNVKPSIVHAGLLAIGAKPGHPAQFQPRFIPPTGTEIAIEVRWKDAGGKVQSAPAQDWIRNVKTKKALDTNWVFAGSMFVTDETTGKEYYQADSGELICVLSLPTAMLDLPIRSYGAIESRRSRRSRSIFPRQARRTTSVEADPIGQARVRAGASRRQRTPPPTTDTPEAEQKAVDAAEPWLALVDRGQYTQSWETAAELSQGRRREKGFRQDARRRAKAARQGEIQATPIEAVHHEPAGGPDGQYVVLQYKTSFANGSRPSKPSRRCSTRTKSGGCRDITSVDAGDRTSVVAGTHDSKIRKNLMRISASITIR